MSIPKYIFNPYVGTVFAGAKFYELYSQAHLYSLEDKEKKKIFYAYTAYKTLATGIIFSVIPITVGYCYGGLYYGEPFKDKVTDIKNKINDIKRKISERY